MISLPPARQARRIFLRLSALVALLAFFLLGSTVLLDQWIIGRASAAFILGTALLIAGLCTGLFAVIAAIGLMISVPLRDDQEATEGRATPVPPTAIASPHNTNQLASTA